MERAEKQSLKENRLHGTDRFPLAAYWIGPIAPGEPVLECHWHSEAELFCVLEGEVLFQVGADYFPVREGEAVFIDGGDIHAGHALGGSGCSYCAIVFDPELLASASFDAVQEKYVAPLLDKSRTFPRLLKPRTDWGDDSVRYLRSLIDVCAKEQGGYEAAAKGLLYLMLHVYAANGQLCNRSDRDGRSPMQFKIERLKSVISYMHDHYRRPLRISELAEQIPMSEGQFSRFFKSMTHQTPVEYLNGYRIKKAAELLLQPDAKIASVAMDVGFDHISYFVKVFRARMKCTPSEYRKANGKISSATTME
ncbi:AraC family transcriptional regulator [Paenibacillus sp. LHD-117]|uniref:AraC family transcriptional regulator n=1 Tax=Paenibacillus sp. LHD-117 TaxID=3071412 RepID=UPI0027DEF917|nr:AraC family transcriptional regulator [Paenibacillus sp. LHD-117]MDQ6422682.1 AraC family transcriptional regulator [Paenibacillus sp. LHD-117]